MAEHPREPCYCLDPAYDGLGLCPCLDAADEVAEAARHQRDGLRVEVQSLTHQRDFWEQRYETQHRTLHKIEDALAAERLRVQEAERALRDLAEADGINKPTWRYPWMRAQEALARLGGDGQGLAQPSACAPDGDS